MIPSRVEYLLMMARDYRGDGDELVAKQNEANTMHARKLAEMWQIAEETRSILQEEMRRFNRWLPEELRQQERLTGIQGATPRVVRQPLIKEDTGK